MKHSRGFLAVAVIAITVLATFSFCHAEVVLRVGTLSNDANQLDPHISTKSQDKILFPWIFSGLVRFKPGSASPAELEPDLAEKWTSSPDGLTWTFHLRKGVKFHGGFGELTAEDVVFSLKRASNKETSSAYKSYQSIESIEALDDYTVRIKLSKPVPSLLGLVTNYHGGMILSKKAAEKFGEDIKFNPIGTGPFAFVEYKSKRSVTLVANKDHFRGAPKIDKIIYRYLPDASSRELAFTKGEIDLFYATREQRWVERMRKQKGAKVDVFGLGELRSLHMNTTVKPLDDIRVRKAIAHALNRDEMVMFMGKDVSRTAYSVVPNDYLGHTSDVPRYEYDPEKSKALLKEAGHPDGFELKVIITKVDPLRLPMEVIQEQLRKVGIKLKLDVVEHSAFHKLIREDASSLVLYGAARFPVADVYLTQFYHSDSIVGTPTAITNFSHTKIADAEIDAARSETDTAKQMDLWKKAQQKILSECVAVPLFELLQVWGRRDTIDYGYELKDSIFNGPVIIESTVMK
jgi:peptide/nickel transport system substrate-binding protein